jgi:hypothetical protein
MTFGLEPMAIPAMIPIKGIAARTDMAVARVLGPKTSEMYPAEIATNMPMG